MKKELTVLALCVSSMFSANAAENTIPQRHGLSGLDQLLSLEQLPYRKSSVICKQTSSMNKKGKNEDRRCYPYIDSTLDEAIIMEEYGPGCVYRIQTSSSWDKGSKIKIIIDDKTVVDMLCDDFFSMKKPPFLFPLVGDKTVSSGTSYSYLPMVFHKNCKISLSKYHDKNHFQVQYHKYSKTPGAAAFTGELDVTAVNDSWENCDKPISYFGKDKERSKAHTITEGENVLLDNKGAGTIYAMRIQLPENLIDIKESRIKMYWDNSEEAQVDAPLGLFFSTPSDFLYRDFQGLMLGMRKDRTGYIYYPMPFWKSAKIVICNNGKKTYNIKSEFLISNKTYTKEAGYFKTYYNHAPKTAKNTDYKLLEATGWGHWVGISHKLLYENQKRFNVLEGDERIYIDNSKTPALHGSGAEDFYNGSYYFKFGTFNLPTHGVPLIETSDPIKKHDKPKTKKARMIAYRVFASDWIPFNDGIIGGLEVGPTGRKVADYSSVAYYYGNNNKGLVLSDELNIGDEASEQKHKYTAGKSKKFSLTSSYEGEFLIITNLFLNKFQKHRFPISNNNRLYLS